jgi:hypothetical protein
MISNSFSINNNDDDLWPFLIIQPIAKAAFYLDSKFLYGARIWLVKVIIFSLDIIFLQLPDFAKEANA